MFQRKKEKNVHISKQIKVSSKNKTIFFFLFALKCAKSQTIFCPTGQISTVITVGETPEKLKEKL